MSRLSRLLSAAVLLPVLAQPTLAQANSTDFTRTGAYQYRVCTEQPGFVPRAGNPTSETSAACIPIDPGELTFCGQVSYTACLRYPVALDYDNMVSEAFMLRSDRLALEFPKASPLCVEAFQSYMCTLSFPQCVLDPGGSGSFVERPICYSYCISAELACGGNSELATSTCNKAVTAGRVAPDRPDVECLSCSARAAVSFSLVLLALVLSGH